MQSITRKRGRDMEKLRDAEGKELTEISKNNLQEFKKILATRSGFYNVEAVTFSEDISFDDIIKDENGKNIDLDDDAQRYLGYCISDNKDMSVEQAKEFADAAINHAVSYPQVIARAYERSLSGGPVKIYRHIDKVIETKPSDFLPLIDAVVSRDTRSADNASQHIDYLLEKRRRDGAPLDGTPSGLEALSKEQKRQFEHIWRMASKDRDNGGYNHISYRYELFEELAKMDVFANYDMPREMRADVNKAYLQNAHAINTLDEKYFQTEDVMRIAIMGYDGLEKRPQMVDTSKARTQAEKNVNIIPNHYKKVKKLLLEAVKKEKSYNGTRSEPYTLTEKFQNLCLRYYKEHGGYTASNSWADLPDVYNRGMLKDVLLSVAREDIDNGNAAKLDKKILQEVLNEDKEAHYSAKLSNEELSGLKLSPRQEARRKLHDVRPAIKSIYESQQILTNKHLSIEEKKMFIAKMKETYKGQLDKKTELEQIVSTYTAAEEESNKRYNETVHAPAQARGRISELQVAYSNIIKNFKDGKPNKNETALQQEEVEKVIAARLNGQDVLLSYPDQKALPLFGRKQESDRRDKLEMAILKFNDLLKKELGSQLQDEKEQHKLKFFKDFSGKILNNKTIEELNSIQRVNDKELKQFNENINLSKKFTDKEKAEEELSRIQTVESNIQKSEEILKKYISNLQEKAKTNMAALGVTDEAKAGWEAAYEAAQAEPVTPAKEAEQTAPAAEAKETPAAQAEPVTPAKEAEQNGKPEEKTKDAETGRPNEPEKVSLSKVAHYFDGLKLSDKDGGNDKERVHFKDLTPAEQKVARQIRMVRNNARRIARVEERRAKEAGKEMTPEAAKENAQKKVALATGQFLSAYTQKRNLNMNKNLEKAVRGYDQRAAANPAKKPLYPRGYGGR